MKLLAIETSCDETAIAVLEAEGNTHNARFKVLGNALLSQIDIHKEYGGVYPMLAKREHAKNLVPILSSALKDAGMLMEEANNADHIREELTTLLEREPGLGEALMAFLSQTAVPDIDAVVVTHGPGLEPALWVGVNFAKALSIAWGKPLVGANHMEGHLLSALAASEGDAYVIEDAALPVVGLLISGGHTQIVAMREWFTYELMGDTRDDAVGEAFDKVARMLDLPYPGGPQVSKLAEEARAGNILHPQPLPRPMIGEGTCDFSFSGLKTAVMYQLKKMEGLSDTQKQAIAREFEDAVADVLFAKTARALAQTHGKTLVIGGGVSGNVHIRRVFEMRIKAEHPDVMLRIPARELTTDNAVMIGMSGYFRYLRGMRADTETLRADGNLSLA
ncbi:MAG TPA: tRNA (adenosine(37)-N6)-threonylcarbamoyltransferase complex transferase subunit TsaD [Candidatus Paceibacterota bacterium]|nr:tRNA (adenosine(37)-N6)-threonylcarbamoyltransferase complex transferase subunit TsaD [Candidatus Paceibacterota bacterium]